LRPSARRRAEDEERDSSGRHDTADSSSKYIPPAFVRAVTKDVLDYFERASVPVHGAARSNLAKFWCTPPQTIHFELWLHHGRNLIELGLHFEDEPDVNDRLFKYFSGCLLEIQEELGDSVWVEQWDKGWSRLYEVRPMYPLSDERIADTAARLCEMIQCLQPYLDRYFGGEAKARE
jgi:hypothetical protein